MKARAVLVVLASVIQLATCYYWDTPTPAPTPGVTQFADDSGVLSSAMAWGNFWKVDSITGWGLSPSSNEITALLPVKTCSSGTTESDHGTKCHPSDKLSIWNFILPDTGYPNSDGDSAFKAGGNTWKTLASNTTIGVSYYEQQYRVKDNGELVSNTGDCNDCGAYEGGDGQKLYFRCRAARWTKCGALDAAADPKCSSAGAGKCFVPVVWKSGGNGYYFGCDAITATSPGALHTPQYCAGDNGKYHEVPCNATSLKDIMQHGANQDDDTSFYKQVASGGQNLLTGSKLATIIEKAQAKCAQITAMV